jgi:hypothetical protein
MPNPNVGMMYPVWAPITACEDGSLPTYGTGRVVQEARSANVTKEINNNPLYGDDVIVDDDNGIQAITIDFNPTGLKSFERAALLGEEVNTTDDSYEGTDDASPYGGFGYIRKMSDSEKKFEAWFFRRIKFGITTEETRTKEGAIQWRTPTINGRGAGSEIDGTGKIRWYIRKDFEKASDAKAFLISLVGSSPSNKTASYTPTVTT